jgi:peptide/nickel transport system substrate-binding protein
MNNQKINVTMRKALSYAIDYDFIIDEILGGAAIRLKSPIAKGIPFHNDSFDIPMYNLTKAREILKDSNWGGIAGGLNVSNDLDWTGLVDGDTPLATYNFSYNSASAIRVDLATLIYHNLRMLGIKYVDTPIHFSEFTFKIYGIGDFHRNMLELFHYGWGPDFADPYGYIDQLFSNTSEANGAQVYDPDIQIWMDQATCETDIEVREQLYNNIQLKLVEEIYPVLWLFSEKDYIAQDKNLYGFIYTPSNLLNFHNCSFQI